MSSGGTALEHDENVVGIIGNDPLETQILQQDDVAVSDDRVGGGSDELLEDRLHQAAEGCHPVANIEVKVGPGVGALCGFFVKTLCRADKCGIIPLYVTDYFHPWRFTHMKRTRTWIALALALCLALSLSACSPKQAMKDLVVKAVTVLGFREEGTGEDEEATKVMATAGGDVTFPEGFDSTSAKLVTQAAGDTLYVAFNGIQNRSTEYFVPASDSITVTGYATTESTNENYQVFKVAVWQLSDDKTMTSYVQGSTIYYTTDGTCYNYTITGLTPGKQYKINISYDSSKFYVTGGLKIQGLGSEELTTVEEDA